MIYELRVYHCVPGRLPDLIKRFDTLTLPLWKKHGIQLIGPRFGDEALLDAAAWAEARLN